MATIKTIEKINWGGRNPFINNVIEIEMKEIIRNSTSITFSITDSVVIEPSENDVIPRENKLIINNKRIEISVGEYNTLYQMGEDYINTNNPTLSIFEKENLRPSVAFLLYFQNDIIKDVNDNEFCLYGTLASQWEVKN
jgi:hypothetical protein